MEGQPENRQAFVPQLAVGPDRAPSYIAFGGMTVDNVITADGHRLIGVCGGNALYSAVGMKVWADFVGIVARSEMITRMNVLRRQLATAWISTASAG